MKQFDNILIISCLIIISFLGIYYNDQIFYYLEHLTKSDIFYIVIIAILSTVLSISLTSLYYRVCLLEKRVGCQEQTILDKVIKMFREFLKVIKRTGLIL